MTSALRCLVGRRGLLRQLQRAPALHQAYAVPAAEQSSSDFWMPYPACPCFPSPARARMATQAAGHPSVIRELLAANDKYSASFTKGALPIPPAKKIAVLACMDARLDPARILGLEEGDAHVIRNAGGRAGDAIRSLIISEQLLGTDVIIILHHTDCGMVTFSNEDLRARLKEKFGQEPKIDFLPFPNLEQSVREDIELLRSNPFIPRSITIAGFIYDVKTGKLTEVHPAAKAAA